MLQGRFVGRVKQPQPPQLYELELHAGQIDVFHYMLAYKSENSADSVYERQQGCVQCAYANVFMSVTEFKYTEPCRSPQEL